MFGGGGGLYDDAVLRREGGTVLRDRYPTQELSAHVYLTRHWPRIGKLGGHGRTTTSRLAFEGTIASSRWSDSE